MNFKKPRQQVAADAAARAYSVIHYNLQQINNGNVATAGYTVTQAIVEGIEQAILSLVEDMYTDVEFEEDMKLRD